MSVILKKTYKKTYNSIDTDKNVGKIEDMKQKSDKIENTKDTFRGDIKVFTDKEKESIKTAKRKAGTVTPTFYHDGIVEYAKRINEEN